ncbi:MAG: hypothetical protein NC124_16485, partial [Clostridium sp.]|nr:hypothetical protein [Clostridium sp.]
NMPGSAMSVSNSIKKVGSVPLPAGWEWQASDKDKALEVEVTVSAVAVYTGADKGNYENETVTVALTRSSCDHVAGAILYTGEGEKAPTCTEDGLGHRECTKCSSVVESGIVVKALGHTGGTATCSKRAVCTRCNQPYGGTDSSVHGSTEVRGFVAATCTAGGYTGDTYCKDCGVKAKTGNATPALGHDYKGSVTREPTTGSEGERTYTCTRCGDSYKESIPRLPSESHTHSYSVTETKAASCTEAGIKVYSCSCGDSYTEGIPATGHSYHSQMTKAPTVSEEGVMTYTCTRCGHSYTRPIAKLPGVDTAKPDSSQPEDTEQDSSQPEDDTIKPDSDQPRDDATKPDSGQPKNTEPDSDNTEDTRPEPGIPFIKGGDGKTGWDVIRAEEEKTEDGNIINVDMNGSAVVPGDIFDRISGRDITITFDMGNGITWSVDGKSITTDRAGDIDFSVTMGGNAIPEELVNSVAGERFHIQLSLAHDGDFEFTAVLSMNIGMENAGLTASLYYYNESTGELEFISSGEVAEDGTVSLAFTHASDYVVAVNDKAEDSADSETESSAGTDKDSSPAKTEDAKEQLPDTDSRTFPWGAVIIGILLAAVGIVCVIFAVKKKREDA